MKILGNLCPNGKRKDCNHPNTCFLCHTGEKPGEEVDFYAELNKPTVRLESPLRRTKMALERMDDNIPVKTYQVIESDSELVVTQRDWDDDIIEEGIKRNRKPSSKMLEATEQIRGKSNLEKKFDFNTKKEVNENRKTKEGNPDIEDKITKIKEQPVVKQKSHVKE